MAKTEEPNTIIVIDDEPYNVGWMVDYIESLGYSVRQVTNLNDAVDELSKPICRAAIIDLNIPALEPMSAELAKYSGVYALYPGLYAARFARNKGYRDRQVIIYSVHQDAAVLQEVEMLRCTYLPKGRPKVFKSELERVLAYDPTTE